MLDSAAKTEFDKQYRTVQVIFLAMLASVFLYLGIGCLLLKSLAARPPSGAPQNLLWIFYGLAASLIAVILAIRKKLLPSAENLNGSQANWSEAFAKFRTAHILMLVLSETIALFGLVLTMLTGSVAHLVQFSVVSLILMAISYPKRIA